jgi:hypothetical protein
LRFAFTDRDDGDKFALSFNYANPNVTYQEVWDFANFLATETAFKGVEDGGVEMAGAELVTTIVAQRFDFS